MNETASVAGAVGPSPSRARAWAPRVLWVLTALVWLGLFVGTHIPAQSLPPLDVSDKSLHFIAYFGLASMIYISTWLTNPRRRWVAALVLAICMVYGAIDELLQPLVNRHASMLDWVADVFGAATALSLLAIFRWWIDRRCRGSQV